MISCKKGLHFDDIFAILKKYIYYFKNRYFFMQPRIENFEIYKFPLKIGKQANGQVKCILGLLQRSFGWCPNKVLLTRARLLAATSETSTCTYGTICASPMPKVTLENQFLIAFSRVPSPSIVSNFWKVKFSNDWLIAFIEIRWKWKISGQWRLENFFLPFTVWKFETI